MEHTLDLLSIQTAKVLAMEAIQKAKSGHPGIALGAAPILYTLFYKIMNMDPLEPDWINRDRFILSAGHGSSIYYAFLHLMGYPITISDLQSFRQLNSFTPGHPESHLTAGVDATTGPLGQGLAMAVGSAAAESHLQAKYPDVINHYTYVLCGDGDLQEGIAWEALSFAGHQQLSKLIILFDSNDIQLDGPTNQTNSDNIGLKIKALHFDYQLVQDGTDLIAIEKAIKKAQKSNQPSFIEIKTIIGMGSSKQGTSQVHGSPLADEEVNRMRKELGGNPFEVSSEVVMHFKKKAKKNHQKYLNWLKQANGWEEIKQNKVMIPALDSLACIQPPFNGATRVSSGLILKEYNRINANLIGGSADLSSSTNVEGGDGLFCPGNRSGRNIKFGVREHAMAAISNGIALHGGLRAFCSGFFVFADYMKPAIRLSAIMELPVVYLFTHDSIAVGEDGPTHQPIEQLTMLRSIPNCIVIRPADAYEVKAAYEMAFASTHQPVILVLTRQNLQNCTMAATDQVKKGAYILAEDDQPDWIIIASGSEVNLALEVKKVWNKKGKKVRLISMPSTQLFNQQSLAYQESILPSHITKRIAIEASEGAHLYRYVGLDGMVYGLNRFGKSGKGPQVMADLGFEVDKIVEAMEEIE